MLPRKRFFVLVLTTILIFVFTACGTKVAEGDAGEFNEAYDIEFSKDIMKKLSEMGMTLIPVTDQQALLLKRKRPII